MISRRLFAAACAAADLKGIVARVVAAANGDLPDRVGHRARDDLHDARGGLLRLGGGEALRGNLIPKIAAGELSLSFAHSERQARYDLADVATTARRDGAGYVLDGAKTLVPHGDTAEKFVVSARLSGAQTDRNGLALFLIDATAPGV